MSNIQSDTRVMGCEIDEFFGTKFATPSVSVDIGSVASVFGADAGRITVGAEHPADTQRGAYAWWPLTVDSRIIGELRDDACGLTVHIDLIGGRKIPLNCCPAS